LRKRSQFEKINEAKHALLWPSPWLFYRAYEYSKDPDRVTDNHNLKPFGPPNFLTTPISKNEIPKPKLGFSVKFRKGAA
jgi:hypothetical protein